MMYNWQKEDWPDFRYDLAGIQETLLTLAEKMGSVSGIMKALPEESQTQTLIDFMVAEAVKTSAIEGEVFSREDVMSSIRNNLGLNKEPEKVGDIRARGLAELMIDVRETFNDILTDQKLFAWHTMLLRDERGFRKLKIGEWRIEEMEIVSGYEGRRKVHFEAPPPERVPDEMARFIDWFNDTAPGAKDEISIAPVRSAIAHLYFESVHPFDDGNGRIGRAISEKALAQGIGRPALLSLSQAIEAKKNDYYDALKRAQTSNEITDWVTYFVETILQAQTDAETHIDFTLQKTKFFDKFKDDLNERQLKVIRRMLREGPEGFEGGMSAKKYCTITDVSKATATRDLDYLTEIGALRRTGGGRSTRYLVVLGEN